MSSETPDLDPFSTARALQKRLQGRDHCGGITGPIEIGPVEVSVGPRRSPLRIEIEPKIGNEVAGIRIWDIE
jgi:hypothetical protein